MIAVVRESATPEQLDHLVSWIEDRGFRTNVSQGAGGYTASVGVYNPSGDFYLTKQEKRLLGIGGGRVGMTDPYGCDAQ